MFRNYSENKQDSVQIDPQGTAKNATNWAAMTRENRRRAAFLPIDINPVSK
jgi:hypothetical protein